MLKINPSILILIAIICNSCHIEYEIVGKGNHSFSLKQKNTSSNYKHISLGCSLGAYKDNGDKVFVIHNYLNHSIKDIIKIYNLEIVITGGNLTQTIKYPFYKLQCSYFPSFRNIPIDSIQTKDTLIVPKIIVENSRELYFNFHTLPSSKNIFKDKVNVNINGILVSNNDTFEINNNFIFSKEQVLSMH